MGSNTSAVRGGIGQGGAETPCKLDVAWWWQAKPHLLAARSRGLQELLESPLDLGACLWLRYPFTQRNCKGFQVERLGAEVVLLLARRLLLKVAATTPLLPEATFLCFVCKLKFVTSTRKNGSTCKALQDNCS